MFHDKHLIIVDCKQILFLILFSETIVSSNQDIIQQYTYQTFHQSTNQAKVAACSRPAVVHVVHPKQADQEEGHHGSRRVDACQGHHCQSKHIKIVRETTQLYILLFF